MNAIVGCRWPSMSSPSLPSEKTALFYTKAPSKVKNAPEERRSRVGNAVYWLGEDGELIDGQCWNLRRRHSSSSHFGQLLPAPSSTTMVDAYNPAIQTVCRLYLPPSSPPIF